MSGILSYGTYVPFWRLQRSDVGVALGTPGGRGTRAVAGPDEDTTTLAVEAARRALAGTVGGVGARQLLLATARPVYLDKTNATAIHAALGLDGDVFAGDVVGSVRSGVAALRTALTSDEPALAVLSDVRTGLPGSTEESTGGDAAAALLCAREGDFLAELVGTASRTDEFLDRWRVPSSETPKVWEERFGESVYVPLALEALEAGLKDAGIGIDEVAHLAVAGLHTRAVREVVRRSGAPAAAVVDDRSTEIGITGTAQPGVLLAAALDRAAPGDHVVLVVLADGVDVLVLRATDLLAQRHAEAVQEPTADVDYTRYLSWRGLLRREPPRRPDPVPPAAPPSHRAVGWKYAFVGSRCACGTLHLPPQRVCQRCGAVDAMTPERCDRQKGTIATFTADHLAYSESPPLVAVVVDLDGGGRHQFELTDDLPGEVRIGLRVEPTFRRVFTANGITNYTWKARPVRGGA